MQLCLEPPEILKALDSSQWAFNTKTFEKVKLPAGGNWVALQDSPHEAPYLVDEASQHTSSLWAPDLFKHKLYSSQTTGMHFVHDAQKQLFTRFQEFRCHHKPLDAFVQVAGASQPSRHSLWSFKMAEGGCHLNWSLFHIAQATAVPYMQGKFKQL